MPSLLSFDRTVEVTISRSSWAAQPVQFAHPFPKSLARIGGTYSVHLLLMFLRLGELTTPTLSARSGIARVWPLLRYLHAIADTRGLRLRSGWRDVDSHLKAVASDDFGVGLGMMILYSAFRYGRWLNGREYLRNLANRGLLANVAGQPPKVGSMKMADYAARDRWGRFHLIECKGTGNSRTALDNAMLTGVSQKHSLVCANPADEKRLIGQRLITGVLLKLEKARTDTVVIIADPSPRFQPAQLIADATRASVASSLVEAELASALGSAGAVYSAQLVAESSSSEFQSRLLDAETRASVEAAIEADRASLETFEARGEMWIGQRSTVPLWEPIEVGGKRYRYAHLAFGVAKRVFDAAKSYATSSPRLQSDLRKTARGNREVLEAEDARASIIRRGFSFSYIDLRDRA